MVLARAISADPEKDLQIALARLALSPGEREALERRLAPYSVLLTGLSDAQSQLLRGAIKRLPPSTEDPPSMLVNGGRPESALWLGRGEQWEGLVAAAKAVPELSDVARALARLMDAGKDPLPVRLGKRTFSFGRRTYIMGVVNVTPDSFSDGGLFLDAGKAIAHGLKLIAGGADVIDVGGESTRPGSLRVSAAEQMDRVLPVIRGLRQQSDIPISVDTTRAAVAEEAMGVGADFVNDISGFMEDPELPKVVARAGVTCCVMHIQGTPQTMQVNPSYDDVVAEVLEFLECALERAEAAGVDRSRIFIDPGIGFGKSIGHNLFLLRRLGDLRLLGRPILVGTSRKSFLGRLTEGKPVTERLFATLGSVAAVAARSGADMVRVHDVAEARDAIAVADAIRTASEGGRLFAPASPRSKTEPV